MHFQNQRSWRYRSRPVRRIVFRIYALLWLIPVVFFLAAPSSSGLLVALCLVVIICIVLVIWQGQKGEDDQRPPSQRSYQAHSPGAQVVKRLPPSSRSERGSHMQQQPRRSYQEERYDDYEQPQAHYPGQRPSESRK